MPIIVYDTETQNLPLWRQPSSDPGQPHIVQLAALLLADDGITEIDNFSLICKPDGWTIPDDVAKIHGITTERAMDEGIPEFEVIERFVAMVKMEDLIVAHNEQFDRRIVRIGLTRMGWTKERILTMEAIARFCTMTAAHPIVKAPPTAKMIAAGFTKWKNPTLTECIAHFFAGEVFEGAHDAMRDVVGCARVYRALTALNVMEDANDAVLRDS